MNPLYQRAEVSRNRSVKGVKSVRIKCASVHNFTVSVFLSVPGNSMRLFRYLQNNLHMYEILLFPGAGL